MADFVALSKQQSPLKPKRCTDCGFFWKNGTGYSDWTWLDTELRCALGVHPKLPMDEPYNDKELAEMAFAEECKHFSDESYDGEPPLISPDGELNNGATRAAGLIRKLAK